MSKEGFHIFREVGHGRGRELLLGNVLHATVPRLGDTVRVHGTGFKVTEVEHAFDVETRRSSVTVIVAVRP